MTVIVIPQCSVYIISYFHEKNPEQEIDLNHGNIFTPIIAFFLAASGPLAGYLENKYGLHKTLMWNTLLIELLVYIFINQINIDFTYVLIALLSTLNGIGMNLTAKKTLSYYPEKKGIISALLMSITLIVSGLLSIESEDIINPLGEVLQENQKFFPLDVSKGYLTFFNYALAIIPVALKATLTLVDESDNIDDEKEESNKNKKKIKEDKEKETDNNDFYYQNVFYALNNRRLWKIITISTLSTVGINFSIDTFRVYGALASFDNKIMQYSQIFNGMCSVFCGPLFGFLIDKKIKINHLLIFLCLGSLIQSIGLSMFINSKTIYNICIFIGAFIMASFGGIIRPHLLNVYSIKYFLGIGGFVGIFGGLSNVLVTAISYYLSKNYSTLNDIQICYKSVYLLSGVLCVVGVLVAMDENDDKFMFPFKICDGYSSFSPCDEEISKLKEPKKITEE